MRPVRQLHVLTSSLAENITRAQEVGPVLVDVTADAFGLGLDRVTEAAREAGAVGLFAANADGALAAREHALGMPVYVGRLDPARRDELAAAGVLSAERAEARVERDAVYGVDGRSRPVAALRSETLSTKSIRAGDGVSYGYTYRAPRDERTALVALGYGDGVHRHAGNRCRVVLGGVPTPIVGRVAMNVFVVSLGDRDVEPGTSVTVFGDPAVGESGLLDWARELGVDPLAVLASIGDRVERIGS